MDSPDQDERDAEYVLLLLMLSGVSVSCAGGARNWCNVVTSSMLVLIRAAQAARPVVRCHQHDLTFTGTSTC